MDYFCYQHPAKIAVAKIQREKRQRTLEGDKKIIMLAPVCQQCADGAQSVGTPLFSLWPKNGT